MDNSNKEPEVRPQPEQIQTFVFFDLETTSLPHMENNQTKITEMALIAIKRSELMEDPKPRVQKKLLECFNPGRPISSYATNLTRLDHNKLSVETPFNERFFDYLSLFIERLTPPVCLVAHNGYMFDYPILRAEIDNINKKLSDSVRCVDTLVMFRELEEKPDAPAANKRKRVSYKLLDVHTRLVGRPFENSHTAEGDCLAMINCFAKRAADFAQWCDVNSRVFNETPRMKEGVRLPSNW